MRFRPGDPAIIAATGRPVRVLASSVEYALVRTSFGQWTYRHEELRAAPDPAVCPL